MNTQASNQLSIVDGTDITTTAGSSYNMVANQGTAGGALANQGLMTSAQNCVNGSLTWPSYGSTLYTYSVPQTYHVQMRFVENGVLVNFAGKEYIFKDIIAAANHITKLRG